MYVDKEMFSLCMHLDKIYENEGIGAEVFEKYLEQDERFGIVRQFTMEPHISLSSMDKLPEFLSYVWVLEKIKRQLERLFSFNHSFRTGAVAYDELGDDYDINSINVYTLYKFTPASGTSDYAINYKVRDAKLDCAWEALRTLTQASKGSTGTPYNENAIPNVIKFVDAPITKDSGSIRISTENAGLRFKSVYTNGYLAYMAAYAEAKGETMEIGTLIAPKEYVDAAGAFTHAALAAKYATNPYLEVKADLADPYSNANGVTTIAGSIVKIKTANLTKDFAGIGYIKIGNEYFYTDTYTVRNVSAVATAALADASANYTSGQRLVLGKLNGTVAE